jgi:hypothetical protein
MTRRNHSNTTLKIVPNWDWPAFENRRVYIHWQKWHLNTHLIAFPFAVLLPILLLIKNLIEIEFDFSAFNYDACIFGRSRTCLKRTIGLNF